MKLRLHDTRAEVTEATRRLVQVLWSNRPLTTQLELVAGADGAVGRWSQ